MLTSADPGGGQSSIDWSRAKELGVAMTQDLHEQAMAHLTHQGRQEDLTFGYWRPSVGIRRASALLVGLNLPGPGDRLLQGNVAFTHQYIARVLGERPDGCGVALMHSHLGPGWQGMSRDDVLAERDRLAGAVAGSTGLPLLGMTSGTDGTWAARMWTRTAPRVYGRLDVDRVRVVGSDGLRLSFHPRLRPGSAGTASQVATLSVWGDQVQQDLARTRVAVIGAGSVGSILIEALARIGFTDLVLVDHDRIEMRNLDRTLNATADDIDVAKVKVAARAVATHATALGVHVEPVAGSVLEDAAVRAVLDCDVLISCVDRPAPRWQLNTLSYAHLLPLVDGGIQARVRPDGHLLHVDWRIHTAGPGRACLVCLGALLRSDVRLDLDGKLDDPDYIAGLSEAERSRYDRRNVFAFSLSVAAHATLQLIGLIGRNPRIGGIGPQHYAAYPGTMTADEPRACDTECEFRAVVAGGDSVALISNVGSPMSW